MKHNDMTQGNIYRQLMHLALPLIGTNFIQTAYSFIDMIWIGRLGSDAVVAIGTAGFFINLASSLFALVATGTGIRIAQCFGAREKDRIRTYIINGYLMAFMMALVYAGLMIGFRSHVIGFFRLNSTVIEAEAEKYLLVSMAGTAFMFFNVLYTGIRNSFGNSRMSFKLNLTGFILNIFLDPLLIFGVGGQMGFGVVGAAYATVFSRMVVFFMSIFQSRDVLTIEKKAVRLSLAEMKQVMVLGMPNTIQRVSFTAIGIMMARIIAGYGPVGIGVQKIGLQVEALSFMTIAGLHGAMSVFVGQNFGAGNYLRIRKGYSAGFLFSFLFGLMTTTLFVLYGKEIFNVFVKDRETVDMGIDYLRIIGLSQVFMCIEIVTMASFNGVGKTYVPAAVSFVFTALRIPLALVLAMWTDLGIKAVWWSISATSMVKGILLVSLFVIYLKTNQSGGKRA